MWVRSWKWGVGAIVFGLVLSRPLPMVWWRAVDYCLELTALCCFPIQVPEGWIRGSAGLLDITDHFYYHFQSGCLLQNGGSSFHRNQELILRKVWVVSLCLAMEVSPQSALCSCLALAIIVVVGLHAVKLLHWTIWLDLSILLMDRDKASALVL